MILDAGFFIAFDRGDDRAGAAVEMWRRDHEPLRTTEAVVAQVWRGGPAQVRLAKLLHGVTVHALQRGQRVGELLGRAGSSDVIDAHLVVLAMQIGDSVVTDDVGDLELLAASAGPTRPIIIAWPPPR